MNQTHALMTTSGLMHDIKLMIYNGKRLSDDEAMALAQYAVATQLNPFVGECWYLPGMGPGPGIAGWRKKADEQLEYEAKRAAEPLARFWVDYIDAEPRETGALAAGDIAVKVVLHDTLTKNAWEKRVLSAYIELVKAGAKDWDAAKALVGDEPTWTAVGIVRVSENFGRDAMPRYERACKRAEKAAIRKRFPRINLPEPAGFDTDMVDSTFVEAPRQTEKQNMSDLGFDAPEPKAEPAQPDEQPEPEAQTEPIPTTDDTIWPAAVLSVCVKNRWVSSEEKAAEVLGRSKFVTPQTPAKYLQMWVSFYTDDRKHLDQDAAATAADNKIANLISIGGK